MGRFPASGVRLHEPRQPKPANAAFRQGRPLRSHGSSLGPEHPQRAIRPACRGKPALGRYQAASRAPSAAVAEPRRGGQGEQSTPPPLGTPPAACPLKRRGAVARDAPLRAARATSPQNSARHRIVAGNSVGMPALASLRESGTPRRIPGISASKPSKEALHRRPIGGTQAKAPRRLCEGNRTHIGRSPRACRTPAAALAQKAPKRPWDGQLRRRKCTKRNAAGRPTRQACSSASACLPRTARSPTPAP